MEVEEIDAGDLNIPEYNVSSQKNRIEVTSLVKTITETGIVEPLIVRKKEDKYDIISGDRRFLALKSMGCPTMPCIVVDISEDQAIKHYIEYNEEKHGLNPIELARIIDYEIKKTNKSIYDIANKDQQKANHYEKLYSLLDLPIVLRDLIEQDKINYKLLLPLLELELYNEWKNTKIDSLKKTKLKNSYLNTMEKIWESVSNFGGDVEKEIKNRVRIQNHIYLAKKSKVDKVLKKPKEEINIAKNNLIEDMNKIIEECNIGFEIDEDKDLEKNSERLLDILKAKLGITDDKLNERTEIYRIQALLNFRKSFLNNQELHNFKRCVCGEKIDLKKINNAMQEDLKKISELRKLDMQKESMKNKMFRSHNSLQKNRKNYISAKDRYNELIKYYNL